MWLVECKFLPERCDTGEWVTVPGFRFTPGEGGRAWEDAAQRAVEVVSTGGRGAPGTYWVDVFRMDGDGSPGRGGRRCFFTMREGGAVVAGRAWGLRVVMCDDCGERVELRGDVTDCPGDSCGARYGALGSRVRDGLEGYEMQYAGDE